MSYAHERIKSEERGCMSVTSVPCCSECGKALLGCICIVSATRFAGQPDLLRLLDYCLANAKRVVWICSPFLTEGAVRRSLPSLAGAVGRGVAIHVYVDAEFIRKPEGERPSREEAHPLDEHLKKSAMNGLGLLARLRNGDAETGETRSVVQVRALERVHNKTLCVDDCLVVEGSFNWLSADGDVNSQWFRHDSAVAVHGKKAAEFATRFSLQQMAIPVIVGRTSLDPERDLVSWVLLRAGDEAPAEPTVTTDVTLPAGTELYFALPARLARCVQDEGVTSARLGRGGGRLYVSRSRQVALELHQPVFQSHQPWAADDDEVSEDLILCRIRTPGSSRTLRVQGDFHRGNLPETRLCAFFLVDAIPPADVEVSHTPYGA